MIDYRHLIISHSIVTYCSTTHLGESVYGEDQVVQQASSCLRFPRVFKSSFSDTDFRDDEQSVFLRTQTHTRKLPKTTFCTMNVWGNYCSVKAIVGNCLGEQERVEARERQRGREMNRSLVVPVSRHGN